MGCFYSDKDQQPLYVRPFIMTELSSKALCLTINALHFIPSKTKKKCNATVLKRFHVQSVHEYNSKKEVCLTINEDEKSNNSMKRALLICLWSKYSKCRTYSVTG